MLMVLIGPSGSGKTTFAKSYIQSNPGWVRVSRDDLRLQITANDQFGAYFMQNNAQLEKHVTQLQMNQIRYWLEHGYHVIVDNPHLRTKYLHVYREQFGYLTDILFVPIRHADSQVCKERIRKREGEQVDVEYIDRHFSHFKLVLQEADHLLDRTLFKKNPQRTTFESLQQQAHGECIIVDLDKSVSRLGLSDDSAAADVLPLLLNSMKREGRIKPTVIYLSDREEIFRKEITHWLKANDFPWDNHLFMRPQGDTRSDVALKLNHFMQLIAPHYRPLLVIEESDTLVRALWQRLGIFCLNASQPVQAAA